MSWCVNFQLDPKKSGQADLCSSICREGNRYARFCKAKSFYIGEEKIRWISRF